MPFPEKIYVTIEDEGTENEWLSASRDKIVAVKGSDQPVPVPVCEYVLNRTFKGTLQESIIEEDEQ